MINLSQKNVVKIARETNFIKIMFLLIKTHYIL